MKTRTYKQDAPLERKELIEIIYKDGTPTMLDSLTEKFRDERNLLQRSILFIENLVEQ